jgi:hypothetical protein
MSISSAVNCAEFSGYSACNDFAALIGEHAKGRKSGEERQVAGAVSFRPNGLRLICVTPLCLAFVLHEGEMVCV